MGGKLRVFGKFVLGKILIGESARLKNCSIIFLHVGVNSALQYRSTSVS